MGEKSSESGKGGPKRRTSAAKDDGLDVGLATGRVQHWTKAIEFACGEGKSHGGAVKEILLECSDDIYTWLTLSRLRGLSAVEVSKVPTYLTLPYQWVMTGCKPVT